MTDLAVADLSHIPVSPVLSSTLGRASEGARASGAGEVSVEHLLAALCDDQDAIDVLAACQIDATRLKRDVIGHLVQQHPAPNAAAVEAVGVSPGLMRILEAAAAAAKGGRRRDINGAIVLAAIVGDGRSVAAQILQSYGLTFEGAIRALQSAMAQPRPIDVQPAEDVLARARERVQSRAAPSLRDIMQDRPAMAPAPSAAPYSDILAPPRGPASSAPVPQTEAGGSLQGSAATDSVPSSESVPQSFPELEPNSVPGPAAEAAVAQEPMPTLPEAGPLEPSPAAPPPPSQMPPSAPVAAPPQAPPPVQPSWRQPIPPPTSYSPPPSGYGDGLSVDGGRFSAGPVPQPAPSGMPPYPGLPPEPGPMPAAFRPAPEAAGLPPATPNVRPPPPLPRSGAPLPPMHERTGMAMQPPPIPPPVPRTGAPVGTGPGSVLNRYGVPPSAGLPDSPAPPAPRPQSASLPSPGARRTSAASAELGQLSENIPRVMRTGVTERVEIRIGRSDIKNISAGMEGTGIAWQHEVTVTKAMSVRVRAPEGGFFIETASPEVQWIDNQFVEAGDDYASWRFLITPQRSGWSELQIIVSARTVANDGLAAETAFPDQVIEVKVRANYGRAFLKVLGWVLAAVAGGFLAKFGEGAWAFVSALMHKLGG